MSNQRKDPDSRVPIVIDARGYLERHSELIGETDTLSAVATAVVDASDVEVGSPALTIESTEFTANGVIRIWLSGGNAGESYRVRVRITGTVTSPAQLQDDHTVVIDVSHE